MGDSWAARHTQPREREKERQINIQRTGFWNAGCLLSLSVYYICHGDEVESHNHIFFVCPYSSFVWSQFLQKNGVNRLPLPLDKEILLWVCAHRADNPCTHVFKLSLACCLHLRSVKGKENSGLSVRGYSFFFFAHSDWRGSTRLNLLLEKS